MKTSIKVSFLIFACIIIYSCNVPENNQSSYFPLKVGNKWYYYSYNLDSFYSDSIYTSCDSIVLRDDIEYFVLNSKEPWQNFQTGQRLFREEDGKIYRYIDDQEYLYLDFNHTYNDPWVLLPYLRTCEIVSELDSFKFYNHKVFDLTCLYMHEDSQLDSITNIYAKNIGLIHTFLALKDGAVIGNPNELIWAIIDGQKYVFK